jgi:uncharacterized membrane protein YjjB (DUF3815 family)
MSMLEILRLVVEDAFWSALAATGFAVLFNVPPRTLVGCALAGATGHGIRTALMTIFDMPIEAATLFGATVIGFLGVGLARRLRAPTLIFSVSGAIPLVPGLLAYSTMLGLLRLTLDSTATPETLLPETAINAIRAGLILASIALGLTMPRLLFRRIEPVV